MPRGRIFVISRAPETLHRRIRSTYARTCQGRQHNIPRLGKAAAERGGETTRLNCRADPGIF